MVDLKKVSLLSGAFNRGQNHAGSDSLTEGMLERPVLLVYTGKFDSMEGEVPVSDEQIEKLAKNHNEKISKLTSGGSEIEMKDCPPLQVDHSVSGWDTVGRLVGPLTVGKHEGKTALYGKVRVLGKENVDRVRDGRWTNVSMGADLEKCILSELTITPFPAAPNAALLSKMGKLAARPQSELAKKLEFSGKTIEVYRTVTGLGNELSVYLDGKELPGDYLSVDEAVSAAQAMVTADGKAQFSKVELPGHVDEGMWEKAKDASQEAFKEVRWPFVTWWYKEHGGKFTKFSKGESMDKEKMKKHLMDMKKCSAEEAEEKMSKMTEEKKAEYWKKMAAGDKDEEGYEKLTAEEKKDDEKLSEGDAEVPGNTKETPPSDDKKRQLAAKASFVKLAKSFRSGTTKLVHESNKVQLSAKLQELRSKAKITPAEIKKIDLDKMVKLSAEAQSAVLQSYEDRQPVVMIGQFGTAKADDITTAVEKTKETGMLKEMAKDMHFSKKLVRKAMMGSELSTDMPTSADRQEQMGAEMPTSEEMHIQLGKHLEQCKQLMDSANYEEAHEHLKKTLAHYAAMKHMEGPGSQSGQNPSNHVPTEELKHMSALVENTKTLQNQFKDLIKLAGPALGIEDESELTEE